MADILTQALCCYLESSGERVVALCFESKGNMYRWQTVCSRY